MFYSRALFQLYKHALDRFDKKTVFCLPRSVHSTKQMIYTLQQDCISSIIHLQ